MSDIGRAAWRRDGLLFAETDAPFNLGMAFAAAQTCPAGVWIAMSGQVFDGLKVRKDREAGKFVAV